MPSRLSTLFRSIFRSISNAFACTRKPKNTDELYDIKEPQFPCYKLPLLVQEHIVRSMDTYEIMQCSLVSPRFRVAARLAKPKLNLLSMSEKHGNDSIFQGFSSIAVKRFLDDDDDFDEILRAFRKPAPTIHFKTNDQSNCFINFFWREQKDQLDVILKGWELTKISEDLWMAGVGCNIVIYNSSTMYSELDDFQLILDTIFRVFAIDNFYLGGETWFDGVLSNKHMFPLALRYRNLVQYFRLMQNRNSGTCADLTSDELSALLDNLEAPRVKVLWVVEPGAKYTGTLKTKRMKLYRASWLTLDNILKMECEEFTGSGSRWTAPELISIVRKWQKGGFEKLKRLELDRFHGNWQTILDGVEGTVVSAYKKEIHRSDGKKAVVLVDNLQFLLNVLD